MDLKIEKINSANASVATTILADELNKKEDKIAKNFAKKAKIDGFRAGKVPVAVIKSRYKEQIRQDAEQEALQELMGNALKELDRKAQEVVGEPHISKFDRGDEKLDIEMKISFRPHIDTKGYKECIPAHSTPRVTKKEISERKEKLLGMVAPAKAIEEKRGLQKGDIALFDFEGFVDGEAFEGGKAEKYSLEIGSGQFIPGFEDGMLELKAGEEKDVSVAFPKEYNAAHLAGKEAVFKVKLHEIQVKEIPENPDEDMLKKLLPAKEEVSVEKLEEQIKEQIKLEKLDKIYEESLKPEFVEAVVEKLEFDLPDNIVEQELDLQVRQNWSSFSEEEIESFKKNPELLQEKRETYRDDASKSVKLTFIVDELARENEINVQDNEVMQRLYFEAMQQGQDPKKYVEFYEQQGVLPAIKMSMIEEKLFRKLFFEEPKKEAPKKPETKKEDK